MQVLQYSERRHVLCAVCSMVGPLLDLERKKGERGDMDKYFNHMQAFEMTVTYQIMLCYIQVWLRVNNLP